MRKRNVFGKRINQVSFFLVLVGLFFVILAARYAMLSVLNAQRADLVEEQARIQTQIDLILAVAENETYAAVFDLLDELPSTYDQIGISDDLSIALGLSGIAPFNYYETILDGTENPLETELPESVRAIKITISMSFADQSMIPLYLDAISKLDRIFYIEVIHVNVLNDGVYLSATIYTFYNDID
jgi:hypothetical protein